MLGFPRSKIRVAKRKGAREGKKSCTIQKGQKLDGIDFKSVISAAELVRLGWRPHGWLLWQMIPQGGITLLAGETASGKSFLGLDLAIGVASGRGRAWDMGLAEAEGSAQPFILSPPLGEGRQRRGEGDLSTPTAPSSTAWSTRLFEAGIFDGPHLPWLDTGSPMGKARRIARYGKEAKWKVWISNI